MGTRNFLFFAPKHTYFRPMFVLFDCVFIFIVREGLVVRGHSPKRYSRAVVHDGCLLLLLAAVGCTQRRWLALVLDESLVECQSWVNLFWPNQTWHPIHSLHHLPFPVHITSHLPLRYSTLFGYAIIVCKQATFPKGVNRGNRPLFAKVNLTNLIFATIGRRRRRASRRGWMKKFSYISVRRCFAGPPRLPRSNKHHQPTNQTWVNLRHPERKIVVLAESPFFHWMRSYARQLHLKKESWNVTHDLSAQRVSPLLRHTTSSILCCRLFAFRDTGIVPVFELPEKLRLAYTCHRARLRSHARILRCDVDTAVAASVQLITDIWRSLKIHLLLHSFCCLCLVFGLARASLLSLYPCTLCLDFLHLHDSQTLANLHYLPTKMSGNCARICESVRSTRVHVQIHTSNARNSKSWQRRTEKKRGCLKLSYT